MDHEFLRMNLSLANSHSFCSLKWSC